MRPIIALRTRKERVYQVVMIVVGSIIWCLIAFGVAYALTNPKLVPIVLLDSFYVLLFLLFSWIGAAIYRANAFGNMILLGPRQFPDLHAMVTAGSQAIGLASPPKTFVYNSNGLINAFARRLLRGHYVFLTSALVEVTNDAQVRFIIGHELGHHAAGHLNFWMNVLKAPAHIVPFLPQAYSRAREYTCDRVGAYLSNDLVSSRGALQMLGCGCGRLNQAMACEPFLEQESMVPPVFGFITEIVRSHPRLTRRVRALSTPSIVAGSQA